MSSVNFRGRKLVVATMHQKDDIIAPILERELGVVAVKATGFETDKFGTFSGEIERTQSPLDAARKKCLAASEQFGCSLAIASEGSFGPHPTMFFVPADDEIVVLMDLAHGMEFKARSVTTETNFCGTLLSNWTEVERFAGATLFPSHGLIARVAAHDVTHLVKGINSWSRLKEVAKEFLDKYGRVFLETDMRAMYNPTRMKAIGEVTQKLIATIKRQCPYCEAPGFDVVDMKEGLPCELCGSPTRSMLAYVYGCQKCGNTEERISPHGKTKESAMYCDRCNP